MFGTRRVPIFLRGPSTTTEVTPNLGAGAAASWEVADLDTLFVERTGASATTAASVDGVVGTVLDKSGTGAHLVAPSDAARPVLRQSGSLYYLEFDGTDDYLVTQSGMSTLGIATAGAFEFWSAVVFRSGGQNTSQYFNPCLLRTSNGGYMIAGAYDTATTPDRLGALNFDGTVDQAQINFDAIGNPLVYHARHDSGNMVQRANGGAEGSFASGDTSVITGNAEINKHGGSGSSTAAVDWYGGLLIGSNITTGERAENDTYMGNLMGLSL